MAVRILMSKPNLPYTKSAYQGFSWTTLIWGPFPALFRADGIGLLVAIALVLVSFAIPILPFLIWAFFYNKNHHDRLVNKGWVPVPAVPTWAPVVSQHHAHHHVQRSPRPPISAGAAPAYALTPLPAQPAQIDAAAKRGQLGSAEGAMETVSPAEGEVEEIGAAEVAGVERPTALESGKPSGWYADPYSTFGERWWDGKAWTEECR